MCVCAGVVRGIVVQFSIETIKGVGGGGVVVECLANWYVMESIR